MQAQQTLTAPGRPLAKAVAVFATVLAATLALALVASVQRSAAPAGPAVVVLHPDQTHAAQERNDVIASEQADPKPS